jgi:hypothetical protein
MGLRKDFAETKINIFLKEALFKREIITGIKTRRKKMYVTYYASYPSILLDLCPK